MGSAAVVPLYTCPAPDCEAPPSYQRLAGHHDDGCPQFECGDCGVAWSQHLLPGACPDLSSTPTPVAPTAGKRGPASRSPSSG